MRRRPSFARDTRGAAAVELVLWLAVLIVPLLSAVDLGAYAFRRMQLDTAAQAAVQAAWKICDSASELPATKSPTSCGPDLVTTMTTAAQSTSLGTSVTVAAPIEGYYCAGSGNTLLLVGATGTVSSPPAKPAPFDCHTVVTGSTAAPGDYIQATASFAYAPLFPQLSVASLLTTPITRTAWMRLD